MSVCLCGAVTEWACEVHGDPVTISQSHLTDLEREIARLREELERTQRQIDYGQQEIIQNASDRDHWKRRAELAERVAEAARAYTPRWPHGLRE